MTPAQRSPAVSVDDHLQAHNFWPLLTWSTCTHLCLSLPPGQGRVPGLSAEQTQKHPEVHTSRRDLSHSVSEKLELRATTPTPHPTLCYLWDTHPVPQSVPQDQQHALCRLFPSQSHFHPSLCFLQRLSRQENYLYLKPFTLRGPKSESF